MRSESVIHFFMDFCIFIEESGKVSIRKRLNLEMLREWILSGDWIYLCVFGYEDHSYQIDTIL